MTLVEFLKARLDEDEAAALAAEGVAWEQGDRYHERNVVRPAGGFDWVGVTGTRYDTPPVITAQVASTPRDLFEARAAHIARHDPARVLAEVETKRQIVQLHDECGSGHGYCDDGGHDWSHVEGGGCADLGLMALPCADHEDYDEAWRL